MSQSFYEGEIPVDIKPKYAFEQQYRLDLDSKKKCGEIFIEENENSFILCTFCITTFLDFEDFITHAKRVHLKLCNITELNSLNTVYDGEKSIKIENFGEKNTNEVNDIKTDTNSSKSKKISKKKLNGGAKSNKPKAKLNRRCDGNTSSTSEAKVRKAKKTLNKPVEISCDICSQMFKHRLSLTIHKKYDHPPPDLFVNNDGGSTADQQTNNNEKSPVDPLQCKYCGSKFATRPNRIQHERIHTGEMPFKCQYCDKCFRCKGNIKKHEKTHLGIKPYKCDMCDAAFTEQINLKVHIRRHKGEKIFKCSFCEKTFCHSTQKKSHERSHTGEKPYLCNTCGNRYASSCQLLAHSKRAHAENDATEMFKCEQCGKGFKVKSALTEHKIVHSGERPHVCEICSATFPRRKALISHKKIHSDVAEYVCKICGKAFKQHAGLYSHMKSHRTHDEKYSEATYF